MNSVVVCNTGSDSISKINISDLSLENLSLDFEEKPIGPHGIYAVNNKIYTANNYNNSISIINGNTFKEEKSIYIGPYPNDIVTLKDKLYITCGEGNALIVYDGVGEKILFEVPVGKWPHNIAIYKEAQMLFVSNLEGNSLSVIDGIDNKVIKTISTLEYPTKVIVSKDKSKLYVCESYIGEDTCGYIEIFSTRDLMPIKRIKVGKSPLDMCDDGKNLFVSNFSEGTISIVDTEALKEVKKIYIGSMPKGILKYDDNLFIGDYLKGRFISLDLKTEKIKAITIGKEPNAMTLY